jgi:hypothetical protein
MYPAQLEAADAVRDQAEASYQQDKDYYTTAALGLRSLDMYWALKVLSACYDIQREIEDQNFHEYDPQGYAQAALMVQYALDAYSGSSAGEVLVQAEEALVQLRQVLDTAWGIYARERRVVSLAEQETALEMKAPVAASAEFSTAKDMYTKAELLFQGGRYDQAADLYFQAEYLFAGSSIIAGEKRRIAEEAIRAAEEQNTASEKVVRNAEMILEGGN